MGPRHRARKQTLTTRRLRARRRRHVLAALAALPALALASACADDGSLRGTSGQAAPELGAAIDVLVLEHLEAQRIPGATVAVTKGGRLVLSKGYGFADLVDSVQMLPTHRTRIGSVSKLPTAIAALQLVEQGELDLHGHLYGTSATPFWGSDPTGTPGIVHTGSAVLDDAGDYLVAATEAVGRWAPEPGDDTAGLPGYLTQPTHQAGVAELLDWMTDVQLRHALSHTAGYLRSGSGPLTAARVGKDELDVTYPEVHAAMMAGEKEPPFQFRPGTARTYSNHGFGLMGQIIAERTGTPYVDHMQETLFHPLGLEHIVPVDVVHLRNARDATSYVRDAETGEPRLPDAANVIERQVPAISTSTGGWAATAQDLVRITCGVDDTSNHLRLLSRETATTMASPAVPELSSKWVLGWDERTGAQMTKDGKTGRGGAARVTKYLPSGSRTEEINVAVNLNIAVTPPKGLLDAIADIVATTDIAPDVDLFPRDHRCVGDGPTLDILDPQDGATLQLGDELFAEALARDHTGQALPVIWSLPDGRELTSLPSPSDGKVSLFARDLPVGRHTIRARAVDSGGAVATDEVQVEVTYAPPTVTIVTPKDGAVVPSTSQLLLLGHSTTRGFFPLDDDQVWWEIMHDGAVLHRADGHHVVLPAGALPPGTHTIAFTGSDGVQTVSDAVDIEVVGSPASPPRRTKPGEAGDGSADGDPRPPRRRQPNGPTGRSEPDPHETDPSDPDDPEALGPATATIERPDADGVLASGPGGTAIDVAFHGTATDSDGTPIDGTRFRWTVVSVGLDEVVCEGSAFAGAPDDAAPEVACTDVVLSLQPQPIIGGQGTPFLVTLEARASDGTVATATRLLHVVIPPVG